MATGRWGWLDLRTLLEEHEGGRCLFRIGARHRLAPFGSMVGTLTGAGLAASLVLGAGLTAAFLLASGLAAAASMCRRIAQVDAGVRAVVEEVAARRGMLVMRNGDPAARVPAAGTEAARPFVRRPPVVGSAESIPDDDAERTEVLDLQPSGER